MKSLLVIVFILLVQASLSQSFISGNVTVDSNGCDYSLTGNYYDSTSTDVVNFTYDSVILAYKYVVPITSDSVVICLNPTSCICESQCVTIYSIQNLNIFLSICLTVGYLEKGNNLFVFPNPFVEFLRFSKPGYHRVKIFDTSSVLIDEFEFINAIEYNTSVLREGFYMIIFDSYPIKMLKVDQK